MLNETVMGVALPPLMEALDVSANAVQWLTTAFLLTMAIVIPITGFLIQRVNSRPLYIMAISLFSLGTLICGLAPGLEVLIVGRVVQASGTAIMMPLLMTTVAALVPAARTHHGQYLDCHVSGCVSPTVSGHHPQLSLTLAVLAHPADLAGCAGARLAACATSPPLCC